MTRPATKANKRRYDAKTEGPARSGPAPKSTGDAHAVPPQTKVLWEDENFAVTDEGIAMRSTMEVFIPKTELRRVGEVVQTIPGDHSANSLYTAMDRAVTLLLPTEFPQGLRKNSVPKNVARKHDD